jgi:type III polyketide synthase
MHPGGATILSGAERALGITPQHMRASYDTYVNHGNSSSASIFRVMHRLRSKDMDSLAPEGRVRDYVVGCAFGPGITVESCILKRGRGATLDIPTPPDTDEPVNDLRVEHDEDSDARSMAVSIKCSGNAGTQEFIDDQLQHLDLD